MISITLQDVTWAEIPIDRGRTPDHQAVGLRRIDTGLDRDDRPRA
jgi:hypothetical protein